MSEDPDLRGHEARPDDKETSRLPAERHHQDAAVRFRR